MYWKSDLPRGACNTQTALPVRVCVCARAPAKLNAGCCWICNSPLKRWGMPSSLRGAPRRSRWMMLLREYSTFIYAQKGAPKRKDDGPNIWVCLRARLSCLPRVIYLFKGKRRARRHKLKRSTRMAAAESFFPDEKGKSPLPFRPDYPKLFTFWGLREELWLVHWGKGSLCCSFLWDKSE